MLLIAGVVGRSDLDTLDRSLDFIKRCSREVLRQRLNELKRLHQTKARECGVRDPAALTQFARQAELRRAEMVFGPMAALSQYFSDLEKTIPGYVDLPPHTRIGIDLQGHVAGRRREILILEGALFEHLAEPGISCSRLQRSLRRRRGYATDHRTSEEAPSCGRSFAPISRSWKASFLDWRRTSYVHVAT